ncbi:aldose 1-epimerase [Nocardioides sp. J9]|uniref:aldose 1-epimerase family protein n=1 Tax=unclassified Nocardioides TaxID=2615069 RepID=UPI00048FAB22|nr:MULTISPECIES: aldose 1-epimerase family protein [unclassified Nocardioides]TWH00067.1 aldose 1-epimerase [Nocardioides sp. J9]
MTTPTGDHHAISSYGYDAVVTQTGVLRALTFEGRDLVEPVAEDAMPTNGSGQLLAPWPNRVRDGRYTFDGRTYQLPLTEPSRGNASHGLVRWVSWTLVRHESDTVELSYRLPAQSGYPWTLDLTTTWQLGVGGLSVTQSATNRAAGPAPYASGGHPYLVAGPGTCDRWRLDLPAATYLTVDDRLIPTGRASFAGVLGERLEGTSLDHAVTDLVRDGDGTTTVRLVDPGTGTGTAVWMDAHHRWVQVYTSDERAVPRGSVAVEPMTAPPDAFNSGDDLVVLEPGATFSATWGIAAVG